MTNNNISIKASTSLLYDNCIHMFIISRNSISMIQFAIKATDLAFILVFIFKRLGERRRRLTDFSPFFASISSFGSLNGFQFCYIETIASFLYHLFESLIILPCLRQTFSSASFFWVVSPNFVTSYTRAMVRHTIAKFFLVPLCILFAGSFLNSCGLVLRIVTEERRVICASQWLVELQGTIFGLRFPLHSKVRPKCGYPIIPRAMIFITMFGINGNRILLQFDKIAEFTFVFTLVNLLIDRDSYCIRKKQINNKNIFL